MGYLVFTEQFKKFVMFGRFITQFILFGVPLLFRFFLQLQELLAVNLLLLSIILLSLPIVFVLSLAMLIVLVKVFPCLPIMFHRYRFNFVDWIKRTS